MKIALKIVALLSLVVNVYFYALWTYVVLSNDSYEDRMEQFRAYFPLIPPANNLWFLVLFTLLSIILVGMKDVFQPRVRVVFAVAQARAFALYVWQLL